MFGDAEVIGKDLNVAGGGADGPGGLHKAPLPPSCGWIKQSGSCAYWQEDQSVV